MSIFRELKQRNVLRASATYVAVAWLVIQVAETLFPVFDVGSEAIRIVVIVLAIGFVPAMIMAWAFELTPEGLKREADVDHDSAFSRRLTRRLDRLFLIALALALGFFAFDKFVLDPVRDAETLATAVERTREKVRIEVKEEMRDASIAVLPFEDLSPEGDPGYFGEGLAVDLIDQLGSVPELRVTGRTSSFSFKGKDITIPEIGEALNVAHVLDGSVSKAGDRIRISVQLIDARHDALLWSETYDRDLGDIFEIRDDITLMVYDRLTIEFERLKQASLQTDPEVYELTLRARHLLDTSQSEEGSKLAANLLEQALSVDQDYVPALMLSFLVNYQLVTHGLMGAEEHVRIATERIEKVLAIDPNNGRALAYLAFTDYEVHGDLESASRRYSDALRTAPGDLELARLAGMFARFVGRHTESIALLERCIVADPRNGDCIWQLMRSYLWGNRLPEALEAYRNYEAMRGSGGEYYGALILLLAGEPAQALAIIQPAEGEFPGHPQMLAARAMIMHDLGRYDESDAALRELAGQVDELTSDLTYNTAQAYAWIGGIDEAFDWLEKAYIKDARYGQHGLWFQRIMFLPIWRNLHEDPRWDDFRERANVSAARLDRLEFTVPPWISLPVEE